MAFLQFEFRACQFHLPLREGATLHLLLFRRVLPVEVGQFEQLAVEKKRMLLVVVVGRKAFSLRATRDTGLKSYCDFDRAILEIICQSP